MSSRSLLAQDDFSALGLAAGKYTNSHSPNDYHEFTAGDLPSGGSLSESACGADEIYRPVNFIPDEVYEMIWTWEISCLKQRELASAVDSMEIDSFSNSRSSDIDYQSIPEFAPPKRFFRTFWRSLTRRLVQHEINSAIDRVTMSCSDNLSSYE
jgi:hypothetical protein